MALFRVLRAFLGGFMCLVWVCVVLRALRGLCGFCARVELGGLEACSVFAFRFLSFVLLFVLLSLCLFSFCLSSACLVYSCCLVCLLGLWLLFLFPFRIYAQKERAQRFCSLRPLLSYCGLLYLVAALYSSYSSGVSPFIS